MIKFLFKSDLSDEEAMVKFQNGDVEGFNIILKRYDRPLYRFLLRMMSGNVSQAEDLFQDVFLKVIEKKKDFDSKKSFKTWLYTVARNTAIDFIRKESYRDHISLDSMAYNSVEYSNVSRLDLIQSKIKGQERVFFEKELNNLLTEKLNVLNNEFREVFILKEIEGLKFNEIAEITDSPLSTVKSRLRYALKKLKNEIKKSGYFEYLNNVSEA
ncbi:MAG: sigma-70 family RNA polymerase sigma factor [Candidatus Dadabacteria bacterium]|nr:sigma-70 family RNA polymerase sigma factor [Candidatus Dadabacteria bacterium]NIQ16842.1 sigma-70 family RNA polymerase sigma factor [Candidatus Dadabacteria bacterium]